MTALTTPGARQERSTPGAEKEAEESKGSWRSWTRGEGLQPSEMEIANLPEVRRKANVCQLCESSNFRMNVTAQRHTDVAITPCIRLPQSLL